MSRQNEASPKYAPAREDGVKPWAVKWSSWGETREYIVYAAKASEAAYAVKGRQMYVYTEARRATPEDVERLREYR